MVHAGASLSVEDPSFQIPAEGGHTAHFHFYGRFGLKQASGKSALVECNMAGGRGLKNSHNGLDSRGVGSPKEEHGH